MKAFVILAAVIAVAVANPLPLVQIIVNVDSPSSNPPPIDNVIAPPVVEEPVSGPESIVLPMPILPVIPTPIIPRPPVIIPGPALLPQPVLPEVVPEPAVLPEPVLPVIVPQPEIQPEPVVPDVPEVPVLPHPIVPAIIKT